MFQSIYLINEVQFDNYTNVDSYDIFKNYTCHIIPMMFWDTGPYLCNYETLFNKCGGGIVPLSFIHNEMKNIKSKTNGAIIHSTNKII